MVAEVGDVGAEVINRGAREQSLELSERLEPRLDVVEPDGVQLEDEGSVDQGPRLFLDEFDEGFEVTVSGHDCHSMWKELGFFVEHVFGIV